MSSFSGPLASLSGDHLSFQINELEWVRTGTCALHTEDLRSIRAAQRVTADAIENSAVLPTRRRQD
jgi:hypothetical protein